MMKLVGRVLGIIGAVTLLVSPASAQNPSWPKSLTVGTGSVGGTFFIYGQV